MTTELQKYHNVNGSQHKALWAARSTGLV